MNHRTVVVLHHYLDLPLDQVADIVGAPDRNGGLEIALRDAAAALGTRCQFAGDGWEVAQ